MSLLKFEYLKNAEMKRVVPVNGVKVVDKNGYIGEDMTEYFPHQPYMNYVNYALVLNGPNYSKMGLGQVEFIDSEYLANIGGREYKTCTIGGMVWLAENLDYKFDVNGSQISLNPSGHPKTEAAWYGNRDELSYGIDGTYKCGLMYNWYAVNYLNTHRAEIIPGWHVPTKAEWENLISEVGGRTTAGLKLKAKNNTVTSSWPTGWKGTDDYGFNVCPCGSYGNGAFEYFGTQTFMWTINMYDNSNAYMQPFYKTDEVPAMTNNFLPIGWGAYVRLVKDA